MITYQHLFRIAGRGDAELLDLFELVDPGRGCVCARVRMWVFVSVCMCERVHFRACAFVCMHICVRARSGAFSCVYVACPPEHPPCVLAVRPSLLPKARRHTDVPTIPPANKRCDASEQQ